MKALYLPERTRRLKTTPAIRSLVQEYHLLHSDFVIPCFITEGSGIEKPIPSLMGNFIYSIDLLQKAVARWAEMGFCSVALFPTIETSRKDPLGSLACQENSLIRNAIRTLKQEVPEMCIFADVALDPYTSHGHDGVLNTQGDVDNDSTVSILIEMALLLADAGVDFVAPSDMMDGRIGAIREALEKARFIHTGILSYAAKFASSLYGPFRDVVGSPLKKGAKKTYQLNPANLREAIREAKMDEREGADILMIKPALSYLDVIAKVKEHTGIPIAAYHVSGEYAMVMAAHEKNLLCAEDVLKEHLLSIKRAGADLIFSYAAAAFGSSLIDE